MEGKFRLNWQTLVEEARQRRKAQNLTQQRLAILAEVSTPTVSRFEAGDRDVQLSSALKILGVLGLLDERLLSFLEPRERFDFDRDLIVFWGKDGEQDIRCAITLEALSDWFRLTGARREAEQAFARHRAAIEQRARRKYLADEREPDGLVLIRAADVV
jgi:transcriptional regulator with XRE-family HTH domain